MPKSMTRRMEFDARTREAIIKRDAYCFFCLQWYRMEWTRPEDLVPKDIMHIVPRSHLGMGVEQNGVLGCRYHHTLMDNGNRGIGAEMSAMLQEYMQDLYPGWTPESVTYSKNKAIMG